MVLLNTEPKSGDRTRVFSVRELCKQQTPKFELNWQRKSEMASSLQKIEGDESVLLRVTHSNLKTFKPDIRFSLQVRSLHFTSLHFPLYLFVSLFVCFLEINK